MPKVDPNGFRKDLKPFFTQFTPSIPTKDRQPSTFLVVGDTVTKYSTVVAELLEHENKTEASQTWLGKKRADVFYFTVKDLKNYIKKGG